MERYLRSLQAPQTELLERVEQLCNDHHIPNIQPAAAQLIRTLLQLASVKRMLEIGTAYGYSALHWLEATESASTLVTIEREVGRAAQARKWFAEAGVERRVTLLEGDAMHLLGSGSGAGGSAESPALAGPFDFVFIDAAKGQYRFFFEQAVERVRPGGLIVTDNVLFRGLVALERDDSSIEPRHRKLVEHIRDYNLFLRNHPACQTTFVPIGDGLAISIKSG